MFAALNTEIFHGHLQNYCVCLSPRNIVQKYSQKCTFSHLSLWIAIANLPSELMLVHCQVSSNKLPVGFFSWGFHNMIASGNLKLNCPSDPDFWSCWLPLFLAWYQLGMNLSCAILVPRVFLWDAACSHVWCHLSGVQLMTTYVLWCYNHSKWHSSSQPFQDIFDACRNKELLWTDLLVLLLLNYCMYIFFFWKKMYSGKAIAIYAKCFFFFFFLTVVFKLYIKLV